MDGRVLRVGWDSQPVKYKEKFTQASVCVNIVPEETRVTASEICLLIKLATVSTNEIRRRIPVFLRG